MSPIELTDLHKSKLLEMCKVLFPKEYIDFGSFYTSEVGAEYVGLDYLDVTSVNHKIPCMKSGFRLNPPKNENGNSFKKFQDGFCSNTQKGKIGFMRGKSNKIVQDSENYDEIYAEGIHWFEFCMTHLAEKILNPNPNNPNRGLVDKFKDFFWKVNLFAMVSNEKVQHPIDYLYEQFKQLKINK